MHPSAASYRDIQQPSVHADAFSIDEFAGRWYLIATNEPTLPSFCVCGVNEVSVHRAGGTYEYYNKDACFTQNITLHIKGVLSNDSTTPGLLHETAAVFNHTVSQLLPNYIFRCVAARPPGSTRAPSTLTGRPLTPHTRAPPRSVQRDASGAISTAFPYACLGKLPVVGTPLFSFNILSRSPRWNLTDIQGLVAGANATTSGRLDMDGMRFNDAAAYHKCGMI